jgi:hypothetical protein
MATMLHSASWRACANYCRHMVTAVADESDSELLRLFARAREPLSERGFLVGVLAKIEPARRARRRRHALVLLAALSAVALSAPLAVETTARTAHVIGHLTRTCAEMLVTPLGWAPSLCVGLWIVLRTRPSRR